MLLLFGCTGSDPGDPPRTNNAPQVAELHLEPDPAYGGDDISAVVQTIDLDGDEVTAIYTWLVDGSEVEVDGDVLPSGTAIRDQVVLLEVTVSDGFAFGTPAEASLTVLNSAPVIDAIAIDPATPQESDPLSCAVEAHDDDGDELEYNWAWTVDGADIEHNASVLEDELPRNTEVACGLLVSDGTLQSEWAWSDSVFIGNSPPGSPTIELVPDPPTACAGGEVLITAEASDPDDDPLTYGVSWTDSDGTEVWAEFEYPGSTFTTGETYTVAVWADDGFFQGEPATLEFQAVAGGETLGNGIDDDCDGVVDEWIDNAWQGQQMWWDDTASAQAGFALGTGDVDGDGLGDVVATRSGESDLLVFLGSSMDPTQPVLDGPDLTLTGADSSNALDLGEVDGDGLADLLIASPGANGGFNDTGVVQLVLGADLSDGSVDDLASWALWGEEVDQRLSGSVALGDLDGDGLDEVVVGDPEADAPGRQAGRVLIFSSFTETEPALDDADVILEGGVREGLFGTSVAVVGDIDGDGIAEVVGGAPETDPDGTDSGTLALWFGGSLVDAYASTADVRILGDTEGAYVGREPASAADIDGDGLSELVLGSEEDRDGLHMPGSLSLFLGSDLSGGGEWDISDAHLRVHGDSNDAWLGLYGAGPLLGDTDGSGVADLISGAAGEGAMYLWRGMDLVSGGELSTAEATIRIAGEDTDDYFGRWALLADTDGDGIQDLVGSAWRHSTFADRAGAIYVFRPPFGEPAEAWEPECEAVGALLFCRTPGTWDEARAHCESLATDLAKIESTTWNLTAAAGGAARYPAGVDRGEWWIGLSDVATEGTWLWTDGSAATFTAWGEEPEPDSTNNCAVINEPVEGSWDDRPCDSSRFFVCR
ncbi:MAG TPA: lectin-like protein [Myxococcota bacterium]|nr:lectin-like protein [Myxococcota bacterium]